MFPLFYKDAGPDRAPKSRPLLNLPGQDFDFYPELEADGELPRFGEMEGMFQVPFPYGFPYMDFKDIDMQGVRAREFSFELARGGEVFFLEEITVSIPFKGAGAFPETNPHNPVLNIGGDESPMPTINLWSGDPGRRRSELSLSGPSMFATHIPLNHVGGPVYIARAHEDGPPNLGQLGAKFGTRRFFPFSVRDKITVEIKKQEDADPRWVGIGIMGRMINPDFLQGVIR